MDIKIIDKSKNRSVSYDDVTSIHHKDNRLVITDDKGWRASFRLPGNCEVCVTVEGEV